MHGHTTVFTWFRHVCIIILAHTDLFFRLDTDRAETYTDASCFSVSHSPLFYESDRLSEYLFSWINKHGAGFVQVYCTGLGVFPHHCVSVIITFQDLEMLSTAQQMLQDSRSKIELIRMQIIKVTQTGVGDGSSNHDSTNHGGQSFMVQFS